MRCPSCGTENAPDSRFCGGCGAKLTPADARVAPTAKISDDARYPQYSSNPPPVDLPRTASRPPEMPQQVQRTVSKPPSMPPPMAMGRAATEPVPPPPKPQQPMAQASSVAMPRSGRRWGLVIAILLFDVGLGAAGVVLLASGGGGSGSYPTVVAPPPAVVTPPVLPKKAELAPKIEVGKTIVTKRARPAPPLPAKVTKKSPPAKLKPEDPYAVVPVAPIEDDEDHSGAISDAIDQKSNHAQATFSRCYTQATKPLPSDAPLRGRIQIAFTVMPTGRVDGVRTAENQTGSDQLATCLSSEISAWTFVDHPQDPIAITKIFAFGPSS